MDISALLSPQEPSNSPNTSSPVLSPRASPQRQRPAKPTKRSSSGLSVLAAHNASLQAQAQTQAHAQALAQASRHLSPAPSPGPPGAMRQHPLSRQGSTSGMDTLADLASMQHHHTQRATSVGYNVHNLSRSLSSPRMSKDLTMSDVHASPPHVYAAKALSETDLKEISKTAQHLAENSYDHPHHVRFINLLRQGLVQHVQPPDSPETSNDPHTYELLDDLRRARQAMNDRFPVGEELWIDWISDERSMASTLDERLSVMELFPRAIADEPSSTRIWRLYGDYMFSLWAATHEVPTEAGEIWSDVDKEVGKEVFTWQEMMKVWEQGASATQWHINDSHLVWDRYIEILKDEYDRQPSSDKLRNLMTLYGDRLVKPHATWDQTSQRFSELVSATAPNDAYEEIMVDMNKKAAPAKKQYSLREPFEIRIQRAAECGDKETERNGFTEYLDWELRKKGVFSFHLINALYERATLRFPTDVSLWEDYAVLLIETADASAPSLPVLERATRHCPWSGDLWAHRLLTLEAEGKDFREIEDIKHKATRTGLLDVGGMEELLKVYVAWCGFLRRRAFDIRATEDDLDIAEVGIRSALEHVKEIGEQKYGKDYKGDPHYRLEKIHIKFFTQAGNVDAARELWKALVPQQQNSYDFWYRYYIFEMIVWSASAVGSNSRSGGGLITPQAATAVLRFALAKVTTMDWPEQLIPMFLAHCEQHESVRELQSAMIEVGKAKKLVTQRRETEAAEAAAVYQQQQAQWAEEHGQSVSDQQPSTEAAAAEGTPGSGKRKREDESTFDESKPEKVRRTSKDGVTATPQKRDREHSTIIVHNLPAEVTETKVRQFFRDCGTINKITLLPANNDRSSQTMATVEFDTQEDATYAQTRESKSFDDSSIRITVGTGTTLWVSNYPPTADEAYIKDLFSPFGEIIDVRFPSLQFNTHRRFCYVQFLTPEQAHAASSQLDGKNLGEKFNLIAKISDPTKRGDREGAMYEGREVYVGNLHWEATENEVRKVFREYGAIERVRIPRNVAGKAKGAAFVTFETKESAEAAVSGAKEAVIRGRQVTVELSKPNPKGAKRLAATVVSSALSEPETAGRGTRRMSAADAGKNSAAEVENPQGSSAQPHPFSSSSDPTNSTASSARERTIALLNLPDTVNDARIRALLEPHGALRKIMLRPDHQGAIVEFANVQDVGKASLAVEGHEIAPGRKIRVGTTAELMREDAERRVDRIEAGGSKAKKEKEAFGMGPQISRPGRPGARRGGRGGLGVKRGPIGVGQTQREGNGTAGVRSNADFRAMFLEGKEESKDEGMKE